MAIFELPLKVATQNSVRFQNAPITKITLLSKMIMHPLKTLWSVVLFTNAVSPG